MIMYPGEGSPHPADHPGSAVADTMIEFFGGLGVIGGSKIMISTPNARVLLDLGLDIPTGADLFRGPTGTRPGHELTDYLNTGRAPRLPGIYDPAHLRMPGPRAELGWLGRRDPRPTAIFISHAHIDHDGLIGFVRPDLACYAHPMTVAIHRGLAMTGLGPAAPGAQLSEAPPGIPVAVADLLVEPIEVDHDVPGACGFLITAPDGRIAYTGDINTHRGTRSLAFADRVGGVDALIMETTMLSFDPIPEEPPAESQVLEQISRLLDQMDLQLISVYQRDLERCQAIIDLATAHRRTMIWPGQQAAFLQLMGIAGVVTWDASRPQRPSHPIAVRDAERQAGPISTVGLSDVWQRPASYLIQVDPDDGAALLDLPVGGRTGWIHAQGEPLGPFMPNWQPFADWLDHLRIPAVEVWSSGHAGPTALVELVRRIGPTVVYPVHGFRPEALAIALGDAIPVRIPQARRRYPLSAGQ
jgi:ribonuclease J